MTEAKIRYRDRDLLAFSLFAVRNPVSAGFKSQNLPPPNLQSFGQITVSAQGALTAKLVDITGSILYQKTLQPAAIVGCIATFNIYNAVTDTRVATVLSGGTVSNPPCQVNIEAVVTCAAPVSGAVTIELLAGTRIVSSRGETAAPYFLFGDNGAGDVLPGTIASGNYTLQARANGVVSPAVGFTLAGTCVA